MKKTNVIAVLRFLCSQKVRNYVNSVKAGMGDNGVAALINDLKRLSTSDMLSVIDLRGKIDVGSFEQAVELFLQEPKDLSRESLEDLKTIVTALGFDRVYHLFTDKHFRGSGVEAVRNIFAALTPEQRQMSMAHGLFRYYGELSDSSWENSPEIMEFLANRFVVAVSLVQNTDVSPELIEYLTDGYALNIAYNKCVSERDTEYGLLAEVMDYASEIGVASFLKDEEINLELKQLQTTLFLKEKKTLVSVIKAVGCASPEIERNMLFNRILPEESVQLDFCFPQNFSMLMETFGAEKVKSLFPDGYKKSCPSLWNWVLTDREPEKVDRNKCSGYEWSFLLADDKLCSRYISEGGELYQEDILTLLGYGKDNLIKLYREKK